MTEAIYNFTTSNTTAMIFRLSPPDIASFEYSANAPFHNVTIMLPIIISVIVLVAVLTTLIAFMRKQELLREQRDCISNSSQNLHLRSSSIRSKDDINEMISYPMVDYHTLCQTPKNKIQDGVNPLSVNIGTGGGVASGVTCPNGNGLDGIYAKSIITNAGIMYSPNKRTVICENVDPEQALRHGQLIRPTTHVTVNSHHIYAEPNPSMQPYNQQRCIVADVTGNNEDSLVTMNGVHGNDKFCALVNTNTHL